MSLSVRACPSKSCRRIVSAILTQDAQRTILPSSAGFTTAMILASISNSSNGECGGVEKAFPLLIPLHALNFRPTKVRHHTRVCPRSLEDQQLRSIEPARRFSRNPRLLPVAFSRPLDDWGRS